MELKFQRGSLLQFVKAKRAFTLMFDETTTMQRKRQMDVLIWF